MAFPSGQTGLSPDGKSFRAVPSGQIGFSPDGKTFRTGFPPLTRYVFQGEHYSGIVMRVLAKGVFRVVKFFLSVFLYTFAALL